MGLPHSSQFVRLLHHCTTCRRSKLPEGPRTGTRDETHGTRPKTTRGPTQGGPSPRDTQVPKPRSHERQRTLETPWSNSVQPNCDRNWKIPSTPAGVHRLGPEPDCRAQSVPILGSEARENTQESENNGKRNNKEGVHRLLESTSKPRSK